MGQPQLLRQGQTPTYFLSIPLSINAGIVQHLEVQLRQITLSINDLLISCPTS